MRRRILRKIRPLRRWFAELRGIPTFTSKQALNNLDDKLIPYTNYRGGTFLEVGANDGLKQSNTYYLEYGRRWRGVLVEAIPRLYEACRRNRPRAQVFHAALTTPQQAGQLIELHDTDLMSFVSGTQSPQEEEAFRRLGMEVQRLETTPLVRVRARTLGSILQEAGLHRLDLLSIDVENYEFELLQGYDFRSLRPGLILIEVQKNLPRVQTLLAAHRYRLLEQLTKHDYLFADLHNPRWSTA